MGCQRCRFAPDQITTPQAVLHMAEKCQPRWAGIRVRPVVKAQDSANYVLIDREAKSQSNRLGDSRIAPAGIPPFPHNNSSDEFLTRSLRSRATPNLRPEQPAVLSLSQKIMEMQ